MSRITPQITDNSKQYTVELHVATTVYGKLSTVNYFDSRMESIC